MSPFSENVLLEAFNLSDLDQTVASTIRLAAQNSTSLYLFFQRYTYFNGYASAMISRLASSIAMSRYLFTNSEILVTEEADRGFDIAAEIMAAASDEVINGVTHRTLAQLTLKTVGDYARLSTDDRNQFAKAPVWLDEIVKELMAGYQGTPGDLASLVRAMGFHAASEFLGDREYTLFDKVIRHENRRSGFDHYLRETSFPVKTQGHYYHPWCWVVIHSRHGGSGVEEEHAACALKALNLSCLYRPEPQQQILNWGVQGSTAFVELQQRLFRGIYRECLEWLQTPEMAPSAARSSI